MTASFNRFLVALCVAADVIVFVAAVRGGTSLRGWLSRWCMIHEEPNVFPCPVFKSASEHLSTDLREGIQI